MSCRQFGLLDPNVRRPYAELLVDQTSFTAQDALSILRVRRPGASISNYLPNYVFVCFVVPLCLYAFFCLRTVHSAERQDIRRDAERGI